MTATVAAEQRSGTLDMGEYRQVTRVARRHEHARPFGSAYPQRSLELKSPNFQFPTPKGESYRDALLGSWELDVGS